MKAKKKTVKRKASKRRVHRNTVPGLFPKKKKPARSPAYSAARARASKTKKRKVQHARKVRWVEARQGNGAWQRLAAFGCDALGKRLAFEYARALHGRRPAVSYRVKVA